MTLSIHDELQKERREQVQREAPFMCVPAIVAVNEDPEFLHRIKVIIPHLDQEQVYDDWVWQMGGAAGAKGYGDVALPALGQEVMLFSEWGQGERMFFLAVFNEFNPTPGDSDNETTRVIRAAGGLKIISNGPLILEGSRVFVKSAFGSIQISAAAGVIFDPADEGGA
jgi:type VI secretion system (T6SS) baseplate-like injector VgrG